MQTGGASGRQTEREGDRSQSPDRNITPNDKNSSWLRGDTRRHRGTAEDEEEEGSTAKPKKSTAATHRAINFSRPLAKSGTKEVSVDFHCATNDWSYFYDDLYGMLQS